MSDFLKLILNKRSLHNRKDKFMRKSILVSLTILCFGVLFSACKNSDTDKKTERRASQITEETARAVQYKEEILKVIPNKKFISQNKRKECDYNGWAILYVDKNRILMTEGAYLAELQKYGNKYRLNQVISLLKYGVYNYYMEMGTSFHPSADGNKILIFNETISKGKEDNIEYIPFQKNKKLESILVDFEQKKVSYYRGNDFTDLEKAEHISEKYLARDVKTPTIIQKIQNKFRERKDVRTYRLEKAKTITVIREDKDDIYRRVGWGLYTFDQKTRKTERIFGFQ